MSPRPVWAVLGTDPELLTCQSRSTPSSDVPRPDVFSVSQPQTRSAFSGVANAGQEATWFIRIKNTVNCVLTASGHSGNKNDIASDDTMR